MEETRVIFITGGCRSGKSRFALDYANRHFLKKIYLATCQASDQEMALRVENHRKIRGPEWKTVEEPIEIVRAIRKNREEADVILLDCITLWLSNLLMRNESDERIMEEVTRLTEAIGQFNTSFLIVSNEVGMGIVPVDPLGRRFRDLQGMVNQMLAEAADTVIFMVSGIPFFLKGET